MRLAMAVKVLSKVALVLAVLAAARCGRGSLQAGDGGSAGRGGSGQGGTGPDGGAGSEQDCHPGVPVYCPDCNGQRVFNRCFNGPGAVPACSSPVCPPPASCSGLDEATCTATPGCTVGLCPQCKGGQGFAGCLSPNDPLPQCPAACLGAPCGDLDESACKTRSDCTVLSCPDCTGGQTFAGCAAPGGPGVDCGPCPPTCLAFDEATCKTRSDCQPLYCSDCSGRIAFTSCVPVGGGGFSCPGYGCPIMPAACAKLDEGACRGRSDCQAEYCTNCQGPKFVGCGDPGTGFTCPAGFPSCPLIPCADIADQLSCDARTDCHSVFADRGVCGCATPGCCTGFSRCADGGQAACKGPTGTGADLCMVQPPGCGGGYVTSYTTNCYEGCVRSTECAP